MRTPLKITTYPITEEYGQIDSLHPLPHTGIDFATPMNTPVECPIKAKVEKISIEQDSGLTLYLQLETNEEIAFAHLNSVNVKEGQIIEEGQLIAKTGNSGSHTTGAHIHVTMHQNGHLIDPTAFLKGEQNNFGGTVIGLILLVLVSIVLWRYKKLILIGIAGFIILISLFILS